MISFNDLNVEQLENDGKRGVFNIGPLPKGYGHTLANALRRVLLSSLEGVAITSIRIAGVDHEYSTIKGVKQTVIDIMMNLKSINFSCDSDDPQVIRLSCKGKSDVTAADLELTESVQVVNKDQLIATITDSSAVLDMEIVVEKGVGYRLADEDLRSEAGRLPLDASFSPVERVMFNVDEARKGGRTDLDKFTLTVITDGSIDPQKAVGHAADVLRAATERLMILVEVEPSEPVVEEVEAQDEEADAESSVESEAKDWAIEDLDVSKRAKSSLIDAGIMTVGDLLEKDPKDLLDIPGFGEKSLTELGELLKEYNINLDEKKN